MPISFCTDGIMVKGENSLVSLTQFIVNRTYGLSKNVLQINSVAHPTKNKISTSFLVNVENEKWLVVRKGTSWSGRPQMGPAGGLLMTASVLMLFVVALGVLHFIRSKEGFFHFPPRNLA